MTHLIESQPLHVDDMTAELRFHFVEVTLDALRSGRPVPLDPDGYVNHDDIADWIRDQAKVPNTDRDAALVKLGAA
jgi:hypothetical protein